MARAALVQFYFDLVDDYKVHAFLPHRAAELYDATCQQGHDLRTHGAACFMVAQKAMDTMLISGRDLASAFVVGEQALRAMELLVAPSLFELSPEPPEHRFERSLPSTLSAEQRANAVRFFHLSVFEPDDLRVRVQAAVDAARLHHRLETVSTDAQVVDCVNRLRSRTISNLGIRLAIAAS